MFAHALDGGYLGGVVARPFDVFHGGAEVEAAEEYGVYA